MAQGLGVENQVASSSKVSSTKQLFLDWEHPAWAVFTFTFDISKRPRSKAEGYTLSPSCTAVFTNKASYADWLLFVLHLNKAASS
eukprot:scaffold1_cov375-Pavlova_lutheri.AAC.14